MTPHIAKIISFSTSDAYRTDPSISSSDIVSDLSKVSEMKKAYHGIQIEDSSHGYLVAVYGANYLQPGSLHLSLNSSYGVELESNHVQFPIDPTAALSAPVSEVVFFTLKEGKPKAEIAPYLDTLASQDTKTVISSTWGASSERDNRLVMVVGWESLKAHQEVASNPSEEMKTLFARLIELSEFTVGHAILSS